MPWSRASVRCRASVASAQATTPGARAQASVVVPCLLQHDREVLEEDRRGAEEDDHEGHEGRHEGQRAEEDDRTKGSPLCLS